MQPNYKIDFEKSAKGEDVIWLTYGKTNVSIPKTKIASVYKINNGGVVLTTSEKIEKTNKFFIQQKDFQCVSDLLDLNDFILATTINQSQILLAKKAIHNVDYYGQFGEMVSVNLKSPDPWWTIKKSREFYMFDEPKIDVMGELSNAAHANKPWYRKLVA